MLRTAHCFPPNRRVSRSNHNMTWIGELACTHRRVINVRQCINPWKNWSLHFSRILSHESYCVRWFRICKLLVHLQKNVNRSFRSLNARLEKSFRLQCILDDFKKIWPSLKDHIQSDSRKTVAVEISMSKLSSDELTLILLTWVPRWWSLSRHKLYFSQSRTSWQKNLTGPSTLRAQLTSPRTDARRDHRRSRNSLIQFRVVRVSWHRVVRWSQNLFCRNMFCIHWSEIS